MNTPIVGDRVDVFSMGAAVADAVTQASLLNIPFEPVELFIIDVRCSFSSSFKNPLLCSAIFC